MADSLAQFVVDIALVISIIIGGILYYLSFPYWKGKNFWDKYTTLGFFTMIGHYNHNNIPEPGKTYAKWCLRILIVSPLLYIIISIVLKIIHYLG